LSGQTRRDDKSILLMASHLWLISPTNFTLLSRCPHAGEDDFTLQVYDRWASASARVDPCCWSGLPARSELLLALLSSTSPVCPMVRRRGNCGEAASLAQSFDLSCWRLDGAGLHLPTGLES